MQQAPPARAVTALTSAEEFTYVTGTTPPSARRFISSRAASTSVASAMSAIVQPAARFGRHTTWSGPDSTSADSAMKCTPQKTMNRASGREAACWESLRLSPTKSARSTIASAW